MLSNSSGCLSKKKDEPGTNIFFNKTFFSRWIAFFRQGTRRIMEVKASDRISISSRWFRHGACSFHYHPEITALFFYPHFPLTTTTKRKTEKKKKLKEAKHQLPSNIFSMGSLVLMPLKKPHTTTRKSQIIKHRTIKSWNNNQVQDSLDKWFRYFYFVVNSVPGG